MTQATNDGDLLWEPPADARATTRAGKYMDWLQTTRGLELPDFDALYEWSVTEVEEFWGSVWEYFDVKASVPYDRVLDHRAMPGAVWFPGARLNYAEHIVGGRFPDTASAVVAYSQTRDPRELTYGELTDQVRRARAGLMALGVTKGDRVVAYLPNIPETLVAFLACASLGAIWASCATEFGERSVVDRFSQIEPTVLLAASGYTYGTKAIDRRGEVAAIVEGLPTLGHVIHVPYGPDGLDHVARPDCSVTEWAALVDQPDAPPLVFEQVPADHPLYVLFSSGTTGLPKAIIHGHGGILVEHLKNHAFSWDLGEDDRLMWFTTTAWMMWNALVSSLLVGCSIVMLDGNPIHPDLDEQWRLVDETGSTVLGLSPGYIMSCRKAGLHPASAHDLSRLRQVCSAGSPLAPEGAAWVVDELGVFLNNGSGGTDVCSGLVQGNPLVPVWAGQLSARCLGVKTAAFNDRGEAVVDELGEFVITEPMPSMPVGFWNDPDGARFRSTYFEFYPGVWRQGDWVQFAARGSSTITGRSDATLNRGGVRLGTGEFYRVVEELPEVIDSLVIHIEDPDGGMGELILFVVLADGLTLDDELRRTLATRLRSELSPRHTPDVVAQMPGVPRSLTGKRLELPVKKMMQGVDPTKVASRDALADPAILDAYADWVTP